MQGIVGFQISWHRTESYSPWMSGILFLGSTIRIGGSRNRKDVTTLKVHSGHCQCHSNHDGDSDVTPESGCQRRALSVRVPVSVVEVQLLPLAIFIYGIVI